MIIDHVWRPLTDTGPHATRIHGKTSERTTCGYMNCREHKNNHQRKVTRADQVSEERGVSIP